MSLGKRFSQAFEKQHETMKQRTIEFISDAFAQYAAELPQKIRDTLTSIENDQISEFEFHENTLAKLGLRCKTPTTSRMVTLTKDDIYGCPGFRLLHDTMRQPDYGIKIHVSISKESNFLELSVKLELYREYAESILTFASMGRIDQSFSVEEFPVDTPSSYHASNDPTPPKFR